MIENNQDLDTEDGKEELDSANNNEDGGHWTDNIDIVELRKQFPRVADYYGL